MTISKRFKKASENLDPAKSYTVEEAVKLIKARAMSATISLFLQRCIPLYSAQPANSPAVFLTVYLG